MPTVTCPICSKPISPQGLPRHKVACEALERDAALGPVITYRSYHDGPRKRARTNIHDQFEDTDMDLGNGELPLPLPLPLPVPVNDNYPFIRIRHHPHSGLPDTILAPGESLPNTPPLVTRTGVPSRPPWAPFQSMADFSFAEQVVNLGWSSATTDVILQRLRSDWVASPENVTLSYRNSADVDRTLAAARTCFNQFKCESVTVPKGSSEETIHFRYRDPWQWMRSLVKDPSLSSVNNLFSVKKFYCDEEGDERMVDEPWTADDWAAVDDALPSPDPEGRRHCYLPVLVWLDKTDVSTTVKMHPIILRALWLPSLVRNASGNAGGVLIGYMPIVEDDGSLSSDEFAIYKRTVYQEVLGKIFESLQDKSKDGSAIKFGNGVVYIAHPGILIASMDAEEAAIFMVCKSHNADVPCPRCLVKKEQLHLISQVFPARTIVSMKAALSDARNTRLTVATRNAVLHDNGLHNVDHFMWKHAFSNPYRALRYDPLHSDELGKWAHHLWPLIKNELEGHKLSNDADQMMAKFPRWRNLKHFNKISNVNFGEGEKYLCLLKSIQPVVAALLRADPLVACTRAYVRCRMLLGLESMSSKRLQLLLIAISDYEKECKHVTSRHGKSFNFIKQHHLSHVAFDDIWASGITGNSTTRPGEGFQQEVKQLYRRTNHRNIEQQMGNLDENAEAVAAIRMSCTEDMEQKARAARENEGIDNMDDEDEGLEADERDPHVDIDASPHWRLCGPTRRTVHVVEYARSHLDSLYIDFETQLRTFIASIPGLEQEAFIGSLKLLEYRAVRLEYQSTVTYMAESDILRCNPSWQQQGPRYDCVLLDHEVDEDNRRFAVARLRHLLRCILPHGATVDVAVVTQFKTPSPPLTSRRPWDSCIILEEQKELAFVRMSSTIRGALLCPFFPGPAERPRLHCIIDTVDSDMFVRINEI